MVSISSTFLRTNFLYERRFSSFYYVHATRKSCRNNVCMKNSYVKSWWNWHMVVGGGGCQKSVTYYLYGTYIISFSILRCQSFINLVFLRIFYKIASSCLWLRILSSMLSSPEIFRVRLGVSVTKLRCCTHMKID